MANGDAALAAGMDVVVSTQDIRLAYDEINKTRDYIATRTAAITPITSGGTGASDIVTARTNLSVYSKAEVDTHNWDASRITSGTLTRSVSVPAGTGVFATVTVGTSGGGGGLAVGGTGNGFDGLGNAKAAQINASGPIYSPHGRANPVTSSYVAAYLNTDGRIGASASSRRFKKEIREWSPDLQAVFALQLVTFRYKASVYGSGDAPLEVGMIAEDLVDLGLDWLVFVDEDGIPAGIHYERVALALLPAIQNLNTRLEALESA
jgi:hypothetical protein